jgi:hypothetical protein
MKIAGQLIVTCLCAGSALALPEHRIKPEQAKELVMASLSPLALAMPGVEAVYFPDRNSSRFLFFTVVWAQTSIKGSVVVGNYAVDPYTADVWSATTSCDEMENSELVRMQRTIRSALHLSPRQYKALKTKGPLCD